MTVIDREVQLDVEWLSGSIGAVIRGLDLRDLDEETVAAIRQVWLERKVVFFPGQHLDPDSHLAFASYFGTPTEGHPVIPGIPGYPNIFEIDYTKARELYATYGDVTTRRQGINWHTDVTFVKRPPLGSILNAKVIPPSGGDTLWSDQGAALRDLSPSLQQYLSTLHAVHDGRDTFKNALEKFGKAKWEGQQFEELEPVDASRRAHAPRNRGEGALRQPRLHLAHRRARSPRERRSLEVPLRALGSSGVHRPLSLDARGTSDSGTTARPSTRSWGTSAHSTVLIQRVTLKGDQPV